MKRKPVVLGSLALAVALAPAHAGTVYVPFATQQQIGGVQYHTEVVVSNPDGVARRFSTVFLASGQNGLAAGKSSPLIAVPPDGSFRLTAVAPAGRDGMLEVSGAPQLAVAARLVAVAADGEVLSSTPLPAVGSGSMVPAGGVAHVQGIARSAAGTSQRFGLINLGDGAAHCTAAVFRVDGSLLGGAFGVTIPARSHWIVPTPLDSLAAQETFTDARLEVTCDQSFYPYVLQLGPAAGQAAFLAPSGSLQSLLVAAAASSRRGSGGDGGDVGGGDGGGGTGGGGNTGGTGGTGGSGGGGGAVAGQDSLAFAGVFLNAQDGGSYRAFELPLRAGVRYRSVTVDFDLYLNQWPGGLFTAVTSLRRSDRTLYYGLILRGDKAKTMLDLGHEQMAKHDGAWKQRTQYHLQFVTDAPSRTVTLKVFQGSALIETVVGNLTAWDLSVGANQKMSVDFGIARIADGAYFPPNGWRYSNLTVQAVPF